MALCINGFFLKTWFGPLYIIRGHRFPHEIIFFSQKIVIVLANSVDPAEMLHYVAFHLGLQCLTKYAFRSGSLKGLTHLIDTKQTYQLIHKKIAVRM